MDQNAGLELARTVLRQGELRLQDQLARAVAHDARASMLAGVYMAAALAALGYGLGGAGSAAAAGWAAGLVAFVGAVACAVAAWPRRFAAVGAQPKNWWDDDVADKRLSDCLVKESWNYQSRIAHNARAHERATRWLRAGITIGSAAPAAGLLAWAAAQV